MGNTGAHACFERDDTHARTNGNQSTYTRGDVPPAPPQQSEIGAILDKKIGFRWKAFPDGGEANPLQKHKYDDSVFLKIESETHSDNVGDYLYVTFTIRPSSQFEEILDQDLIQKFKQELIEVQGKLYLIKRLLFNIVVEHFDHDLFSGDVLEEDRFDKFDNEIRTVFHALMAVSTGLVGLSVIGPREKRFNPKRVIGTVKPAFSLGRRLALYTLMRFAETWVLPNEMEEARPIVNQIMLVNLGSSWSDFDLEFDIRDGEALKELKDRKAKIDIFAADSTESMAIGVANIFKLFEYLKVIRLDINNCGYSFITEMTNQIEISIDNPALRNLDILSIYSTNEDVLNSLPDSVAHDLNLMREYEAKRGYTFSGYNPLKWAEFNLLKSVSDMRIYQIKNPVNDQKLKKVTIIWSVRTLLEIDGAEFFTARKNYKSIAEVMEKAKAKFEKAGMDTSEGNATIVVISDIADMDM